MSELIVLKFEGSETATDVRDALRSLERNGLLGLEDAAVVRRDADGKIQQQNQVSNTTKLTTFGGAVIGLLVGSLFFPIGGMVAGAAGGALVGKLLDRGVDPTFVKEVGDALKPGESALFIVAHSVNRDAALATLRQFHGKVYHTTLGPDIDAALRQALARPPQ